MSDEYLNLLEPVVKTQIQDSNDPIFESYGSDHKMIAAVKMMTYELIMYGSSLYKLLMSHQPNFFDIPQEEENMKLIFGKDWNFILKTVRQKIIMVLYLHYLRFSVEKGIEDMENPILSAHDEVILWGDKFRAQISRGEFKDSYNNIMRALCQWKGRDPGAPNWILFYVNFFMAMKILPTITEAIISPLSGNSNPYLVKL